MSGDLLFFIPVISIFDAILPISSHVLTGVLALAVKLVFELGIPSLTTHAQRGSDPRLRPLVGYRYDGVVD